MSVVIYKLLFGFCHCATPELRAHFKQAGFFVKTLGVCVMVIAVRAASQVHATEAVVVCGVIALLGAALYYSGKRRSKAT